MPKTTKREETRRASRIARAHATELPKLEVKDAKDRQRPPGYKAPARGIARYPWATAIALMLILLLVLVAYVNHYGPFALPKHQAVKPTATVAPIPTKPASQSPCVSSTILSQVTKTSPIPDAASVQKINHTYSGAQQVVDNHKLYCVGINTNKGLIVVELNPSIAPKTVNNFVFLAEHHFYDGLTFHRVLPDTSSTAGQIHIIQGGDPKGDGTGGPGYQIAEEPVKGDYTAGTIAMAKGTAANTTGSQFFINITDNTLPKQYSLFGRVVQGMDVVKQIQGPNDQQQQDPKIHKDVMYYVIAVPAS
ncbi:MAG TPA: peptidylprolyl isomerase [Ktedonobacteraceae bacterium]|nr:peptidylprolyl isomerase [Ktedonobacteraceae bacterium]